MQHGGRDKGPLPRELLWTYEGPGARHAAAIEVLTDAGRSVKDDPVVDVRPACVSVAVAIHLDARWRQIDPDAPCRDEIEAAGHARVA